MRIQVPIYEIQGNGYGSAMLGSKVVTRGIVTGFTRDGFYLQDATGDGDDSTSDAILVSKRGGSRLRVGDEIEVNGKVEELEPRGRGNAHTITSVRAKGYQVLSNNNPLPKAVILSAELAGGRIPPEGDRIATINFWASLESMRLVIPEALAISPSNRFGDYVVLPDAGRSYVGPRTRRGGLLENGRAHLAAINFKVRAGSYPQSNVGAKFLNVEGHGSYRSSGFQIFASNDPSLIPGPELVADRTTLIGTQTQLTIGNINALNLDPQKERAERVPSSREIDDDLGDGRFDAIAAEIKRMGCPDVLTLQEIQDGDGAESSQLTDATRTLETLNRAMVAQGVPEYRFLHLAPPTPNTDGGQPNGNIQNVVAVRTDRISVVGEPVRIGEGNPAFDRSRKPLVTRLKFRDHEVTVVNVHLKSMLGSQPWNAPVPEPEVGGRDKRMAQAQFIAEYLADLRAAGEDVVVIGDFNTAPNSPVFDVFAKAGLGDITEPTDYDYVFRGVGQMLTHIVTSENMRDSGRVAHEVLLNQADFGDKKVSDHNVAVMAIALPGHIPTRLETESAEP